MLSVFCLLFVFTICVVSGRSHYSVPEEGNLALSVDLKNLILDNEAVNAA